MKKHIPTGLSLPTELYQKIEIARGDISRSRYLLRLLEKTLEENETPLVDCFKGWSPTRQSSMVETKTTERGDSDT
jgi:hypothetical protein